MGNEYEFAASAGEYELGEITKLSLEMYRALPDFAGDEDLYPFRLHNTTAPGLDKDNRTAQYFHGGYALYYQAEDGNIFRATEVINSLNSSYNTSVIIVSDALNEGNKRSKVYGRNLIGAGYIIAMRNYGYEHMIIKGLTHARRKKAESVVESTKFARYVIGTLLDHTMIDPKSSLVEQLERSLPDLRCSQQRTKAEEEAERKKMMKAQRQAAMSAYRAYGGH